MNKETREDDNTLRIVKIREKGERNYSKLNYPRLGMRTGTKTRKVLHGRTNEERKRETLEGQRRGRMELTGRKSWRPEPETKLIVIHRRDVTHEKNRGFLGKILLRRGNKQAREKRE